MRVVSLSPSTGHSLAHSLIHVYFPMRMHARPCIRARTDTKHAITQVAIEVHASILPLLQAVVEMHSVIFLFLSDNSCVICRWRRCNIVYGRVWACPRVCLCVCVFVSM